MLKGCLIPGCGPVAVVGQDDVHEVFADVVDIALDRRDDDRALRLALGLLHESLQVRHRHLHDLGALEHERQLHLARAEEIPTTFIPARGC
jgi:hypothetical protein